MNLFEKISHIYIQVEPCDLRKGIDGYAALVNSEFNMDPMDSNSLYIFCNRNHNKLKCCTMTELVSGFYISDWNPVHLNGQNLLMKSFWKSVNNS